MNKGTFLALILPSSTWLHTWDCEDLQVFPSKRWWLLVWKWEKFKKGDLSRGRKFETRCLKDHCLTSHHCTEWPRNGVGIYCRLKPTTSHRGKTALGHGGKEGRGLIGHATPAVGGETVARCIQPMEQCDAWIGWLMTDGTSLESRDACEWLFFSFFG